MNIVDLVKKDWAKVEGVEHTVVAFFVKEYAAFYKDEPKINKIVDDTVRYVEIGLPIVLSVTGGAALAPEVTAILEEVVSDLKVVSTTIYDFGPNPTSASILGSVQSNLDKIAAAAHITDTLRLAKLKLIVNAVSALAAIIAKAVEAAEAATQPAAEQVAA